MGELKVFPFFLDHLFEKIAVEAIEQFLRGAALRLAAAEGAGNAPAEAATMLAMVDPLEMTRHGDWTEAKLRHMRTAGLAAAIFNFPAILFPMHIL
jgi:hypothetical protein